MFTTAAIYPCNVNGIHAITQ